MTNNKNDSTPSIWVNVKIEIIKGSNINLITDEDLKYKIRKGTNIITIPIIPLWYILVKNETVTPVFVKSGPEPKNKLIVGNRENDWMKSE